MDLDQNHAVKRPGRKIFYCVGLIVIAMLGLPSQADLPRPNIVLIYVDDLGYGDLSSYGHPIIETPNLTALAASGIQLTNYYAPSALCSPSRAALLTGRHPYRTGIQSWIPKGTGIYLKADEVTLPEVLKTAGYETALIGKWHLNSDLGNPQEPQPNDQGFDYFFGHNAFQIPTNRNPTNLYRNRTALPTQSGYTAQIYADQALAWLSDRSDDTPFFLMLSMAEPHTPIENPEAMNAKYRAYTQGTVVPIPSGAADIPKDKLIARGPGEYYANIDYMDAQLGRVLAFLDETNRAPDTIIVFASDNGPVTSDWINWYEVNAYGSTGGLKGRKHFLHEGGIKVPAIIRYPSRLPAGIQSNQLMTGTDWFATLLSLAGVAPPRDRPIDSVDMGFAADQTKPPASRILHWALPTPDALDFAVREGAFKLLIDRTGVPRELFNLQEDPLELFNLVEVEPVITARLLAYHHDVLNRINADPLLRRPTASDS